MNRNPRSEAEVFNDLAALAVSSGYAHAVAHICYRDNMVMYQKEMKSKDLEKMFSHARLIRTEVTTLLGLMARKPLNLELPAGEVVQEYVKRTDHLMEELHAAMRLPMREATRNALQTEQKPADIWRGEAFREPMFYGGESAYSFQYRDLVTDKYGADDQWFIQSKGFSVHQAQAIARAMCGLIDDKSTRAFAAARNSGSDPSHLKVIPPASASLASG